jgi:hypothetical protein
MLNFQKKKPAKGVAFSLDPVQREQAKAPLARRRYTHLLFLAGVMCISGYLLWSYFDKIRNSLNPVTNRLNQEITLTPMVKPSIVDLPAMPDAATIAANQAEVPDHLAKGTVPLWIDQPDATTMAWVAAKLASDRSAPPLPQRVEARDLALRRVKVGENIAITGMLEDSQPALVAGASDGYQRLLVSLPNQQYMEVIAQESARELLIGEEVVVVGRYLGFATLQPEGGATDARAPAGALAGDAPDALPADHPSPIRARPHHIEVPLVAARTVVKPAVQRETLNPYVMDRSWKLPEDIYQNLDDDLLMIETRPYYYTLGQVLLDRRTPEIFATAKNANECAGDIHKDPAKFRGELFTVSGHVFHAWEEIAVAQDQPFGVERVVRIILWNENWGDWEVSDGKNVKTTRKLILRAFEFAAITNEPLPLPGAIITANGRFLRLRSMEVKANEARSARDRQMGIQRQSERAHTFLFVTDGFTAAPVPPQADRTWLMIGVLFAGLLLAGGLLRLSWRESKKKDLVYDSVRKLRESRHALTMKQKSAKSEAEALPSAPETPPDQPVV